MSSIMIRIYRSLYNGCLKMFLQPAHVLSSYTGPLSAAMGGTVPMYPRLEAEEAADIETRLWENAKLFLPKTFSRLTSAAPPPCHTLWAGSWRSRPGPGHRGPSRESDWSTTPLENSLRRERMERRTAKETVWGAVRGRGWRRGTTWERREGREVKWRIKRWRGREQKEREEVMN